MGLCLERGAELVTAMVGVWLAGAAYLPLDPGYPAARLGFMLAASRAALVVGTGDVLGEVPAGRVRVIQTDDPVVAAQVAGMPAGVPAVRRAGGQLAYVIFTSGSTGVPKGVAVTHRGLVNYVAWAAAAYRVDGGCGAVLQFVAGFDLSVTSIVVPLVAGAAVVVSREGGPEGLAAVLASGAAVRAGEGGAGAVAGAGRAGARAGAGRGGGAAGGGRGGAGGR